MGRRSSKLCPVAVGLLALVAHGCAKKPESYPLHSQPFVSITKVGIVGTSLTKRMNSRPH